MGFKAPALALLVVLSSVFGRPARAESIAALSDELEDLFPNGRHRAFTVATGDAEAMVRAFLARVHDASTADEFDWQDDATDLAEDDLTAGTLRADVVAPFVAAALSARHGTSAERSRILVQDLLTAGAVFAFDGFWQNACAAPTPFLLILDFEHRRVRGIDLAPCRE